MSPTITGRIVDEDGNGCPGLMAEVPVEYLLKPQRFRSAVTQADGRFTLKVPDMTDLVDFTPSLSVRAVDKVLRPVSADRTFTVTGASHEVGDVPLRRADRDGLLVTLMTGTAPFFSDANALKVLIDGEEAFGRVVDELERLQEPAQAALPHRVDVTQLFFDRPPVFDADAAKEEPKLIFRFVPATIVPVSAPSLPIPRPGDRRPERLLLDVARGQSPVKVRVLLNEPSISRREGIFWLLAVPLAGAGIVGALAGAIGLLFGIGWVLFFPFAIASLIAFAFIEAAIASQQLAANSHVEELTAYFQAAIAASAPAQPQIAVRGFKQPLPNHGVMHPKMVIVDGERAVVLGSPFGQRYFDDQLHPIEDPRRGGNRSPVVHDVSVAVIGPAARHIDETFHMFWNEDLQTAQPIPATAPAAQTGGEDGLASVQIVRTLSGQRFDSLNDRSEKGILEAYLRAFAAARNVIFVETQYFTDSIIKDALVEVLRDTTSQVQVILLLNIKPDIPRYPERQAKHVEALRAVGSNRLGVFTRWSYDHTKTPPWVAPVYLHTKAAVVDDRWATIGSANLDGLSLDHSLVFSPLVFGETTATEVNVLMFNGGPHPASPLVDLVRRRLWAEHLGLLGPGGTPNANDSDLTKPITTDWLARWRQQAQAALQHVKDGRAQALPGFVLEYPEGDAGALQEPRRHLAALVKDPLRVRPIGTIRPFDFFSQRWTGETGEDTS